MLSYRTLLVCVLFTYISTQIVYVPVTQIGCQDYTTYDECVNGEVIACAWCDSTAQCGTCNYCTGELFLISETMCPDDTAECIKNINCIGGELVALIVCGALVTLVICCAAYLTKHFLKDKTVIFKLFGVVCCIYTLIGLVILIGGIIVWVISIFIPEENYDIFMGIIDVMGYYILSGAVLAFSLLIILLIICFLTVIFIVSASIGKGILECLQTCLTPCGTEGRGIYQSLKIGIVKCYKILITCLPCWKIKIDSALEQYDEL